MSLACDASGNASCVAQRATGTRRKPTVAEAAGADTVVAVAVVDYRARRTTGPKRSAVKGQGHLADLLGPTQERHGDRAMPFWAQREASAPV